MLKELLLKTGILISLLTPVSSFAQKRIADPGKTVLKENWYVQQSGKINLKGSELSTNGISTGNWYKTSVPSTVMGALTRNGLYKDIFVGENYNNVETKQFDQSWWFRKQFEAPAIKHGQHVTLHFDGINYYANIWLNGKLLASRDSVFGTFRRFEFDITKLLHNRNNVLAVEIFRAQPGDFNLGFVDWNPRPVDENMGIWREVYLKITGEVSINNTYVESKVNTATLKEASLTIKTSLKNNSTKTEEGFLTGKIENREFSYPVVLKAGQTLDLVLTSTQIPELHIKNPRLWWCNNLGSPELYQLELHFKIKKQISDSEKIQFGIRQIEMYTNPDGHKGFKLNGKEVLIKGAGWTDDLFLRDSMSSIETQIQYVKHMNLNTIRLESIWGNTQDIYDLCDKYGIMVMVGWSCQWEWDEYLGKTCDQYGGIQTDQEMALALTSFRDQILWLRNHPSIFVWMIGSDKCPKPELELKYDSLFKTLDNRPYLTSAGTRVSAISGPTGVKMNGPYEYVAPVYWYYDTINGGAFGFNTETGPGAQVPVLESLKRMIPADQLWPLSKAWDFHCTHSKFGFNTMEVTTEMLENRYGKPADLDDYLLKADAQGYEAMRAMFEAFRVRLPKTTGIIQWMLNSAWPSTYWQLYDYYLLPTSAYYATRKANEPLQLMYDYQNNSVFAVNETVNDAENLKASIRIFNLDSKLLSQQDVNFTVSSNNSEKVLALEPLTEAVFLDVRLFDNKGKQLAQNFYWLSDKPDVFDWKKTTWAYTPMEDFADYTGLNKLPATEISASYLSVDTGDNLELTAKLQNHSDKIAFFINLALLDGNGNQVYPVFWDDNYISLLPGEKRNISCSMPKGSLKSGNKKLQISGWNVRNQSVEVK
ncbi:MAG: sugar-binding domain-containing protein [Lentimicrobiaceae bacterium]|jgi:exo-1,4-beta-D-glucosaminidase